MPKKGKQPKKLRNPASPPQRLSRITSAADRPEPAPIDDQGPQPLVINTQYDLNNHVMENLDINKGIVDIYYEKIKELSSLTGRSETLAGRAKTHVKVNPDYAKGFRTQTLSRGGNPKKTKNKRNKRNKRKTNKRRHK